MLFSAKCTRLVYRVTSSDANGETCLVGYFHSPNDAQAHAVSQMLCDKVWGTKMDIVRMDFDGWKVVG